MPRISSRFMSIYPHHIPCCPCHIPGTPPFLLDKKIVQTAEIHLFGPSCGFRNFHGSQKLQDSRIRFNLPGDQQFKQCRCQKRVVSLWWLLYESISEELLHTDVHRVQIWMVHQLGHLQSMPHRTRFWIWNVCFWTWVCPGYVSSDNLSPCSCLNSNLFLDDGWCLTHVCFMKFLPINWWCWSWTYESVKPFWCG